MFTKYQETPIGEKIKLSLSWVKAIYSTLSSFPMTTVVLSLCHKKDNVLALISILAIASNIFALYLIKITQIEQ